MMVVIIRLLILAAIAWFGYRLVRKLLALPPGGRQDDAATGGEAQQKTPEVMQRCAQCGVHVPLGESTQSRGRVFCSEAHRDNWFRDNPQP
ncbi:PP0621 family protein [Amnimonas aquatica]|uniref:Uncharacterized protein n=1 Tax=Amnimonas aquatica TaxID=2094561 RepID=A0A2P6ARP3_9GAMM|nr:PP0621 family protein [Amnimonas aquatica]PQA37643.1 hypothetical protein C5O18_07400 [Amnimonas aquatica]